MARVDIGERIAELREERLLKQTELADKAHISPSTLSLIESGKVPKPHIGTLRKIARALEIHPQELTSPKAESRSPSDTEERRYSTSTSQLRKYLQQVESWVVPWLGRIEQGNLTALEADTMRMAAYLYRSALENTVDIIGPMDDILEASERGKYVPEDLLEAAQKLANAIRGPRGLQAIPDLALQASRAFENEYEDAAHKLRVESVVNLPERRRAS